MKCSCQLTSLEFKLICESISTIPKEYELDAQSEERELDSFETFVCESIQQFQQHRVKDSKVLINDLTVDQLFEIYDAVSCWPETILGQVERQGYIEPSSQIFCRAIQKLYQSAGVINRVDDQSIYQKLFSYPTKEEN